MSDHESLRLAVDPTSSTAPFLQIREELRRQIVQGELPFGTRLPAVRALAERLDVAAGTVARAYKELEADELLATNGRNGTTVAAVGDALERQGRLAAQAFAARVTELGLSPETALDYVRAALPAP
ncbi:GntR family transcriptional regulator [Naasia lichenicola]|uniref:GntR family transcriptional regulator n=1 Tax=Naasia lichenicola TaxID=2565933 RepID=A0A4S4FGM8_9MICO|nr:GntR family transcriptional regulator [Naasia lichenicola]THG29420.1 GntR family transcriptional regulator [Naasia lichenicola]